MKGGAFVNKIMASSLLMTVVGMLGIWSGLAKGRVWGEAYISTSRIRNVTEREGVTHAFAYIPVVFGTVLIVLGRIIFTVTYVSWTRKYWNP
jgi:hypothetical protein